MNSWLKVLPFSTAVPLITNPTPIKTFLQISADWQLWSFFMLGLIFFYTAVPQFLKGVSELTRVLSITTNQMTHIPIEDKYVTPTQSIYQQPMQQHMQQPMQQPMYPIGQVENNNLNVDQRMRPPSL